MSTAGPASIMLVDDVEVERQLMRMLLERSGRFLVVAEAGDGIEALERAPLASPDVILLDLSMPRMDGLEALPLLRAAVPDAHVVVMSGFSASQQAARVLGLGAHSYLEKGSPAQSIVDHLSDVVGLSDRSTSPPAGPDRTVRARHAKLAALDPALFNRDVIDALHEGVVVQDATGTIVACNPSAERLLGIGRESLVQRRSEDARWQAVDGEGVPLAGDQHPAMVALRTGMPQTDSLIGVADDDGRRRWLLVNATPLTEEGDAPYGVVASFVDVTEQHQTRSTLEAQRAELARSNAELAQFAAVASHDLSEPLRVIRGFARELLEEHSEELSGSAQLYAGLIAEAGGRMQALIDDLLTYAQVGSHDQPATEVALDDVLTDVRAMLSATIAETGAAVSVEPLPVVLGHASDLRQLLQNLLSNALKFTRPGHAPTVRIRVADRRAGEVELHVEDDGIGIPEDEREQVFGMFERLHGREEYPGTGLGLALARKVVDLGGGAITLQDAPGGGTRVVLTLPTP